VQNRRLNGLDLVVPDRQPVRWALRLLYGINLPDRVYGPNLTLKVLEAAALTGLPVFFYGNKPETLNRLVANIGSRYPALLIAGTLPSRFRRLSREEKSAVADEIERSGAKLVFVVLGCPRQETWAFEYRAPPEHPNHRRRRGIRLPRRHPAPGSRPMATSRIGVAISSDSGAMLA
jgi:N-acetylglucosaminyldiphosphoundecaprenol N-acetyl-beta-D-mannosaminyltransferase